MKKIICFIIIINLAILLLPLNVFASDNIISTVDEARHIFYKHINERDTEFDIRFEENLYNEIGYDWRKIIYSNYSDDYIEESFSYRVITSQNNRYFHFIIDYINTIDEEKYVNDKVKEIIAVHIKDNMTDYEKVNVLYKYAVNIGEYSCDNNHNYSSNNPYSLLVNKRSKCKGYSMLLYKLLTEAGLSSCIVRGVLKNGMYHVWNQVRIDGKWYHLDVTQDAKVEGNDKTNITNNFFLVSDTYLVSAGYTWDKELYHIAPKDKSTMKAWYIVTLCIIIVINLFLKTKVLFLS